MRTVTAVVALVWAGGCVDYDEAYSRGVQDANDQLSEDVTALRDQVEALQSTVDAHATTIQALQSDLDAMGGTDLGALANRVTANETNIAANAADISTNAGAIGDHDTDIALVRSDLTAAEGAVTTLQTDVGAIQQDYATATATALASTDVAVAANAAAFANYLPATDIQATYATQAALGSLDGRVVALETATYLDQSALDTALLDYTTTTDLQATYATQSALSGVDGRVVVLEGLVGGEDVVLLADDLANVQLSMEQSFAGEVRYSLLSEVDFQALYGTDWVLMDARSAIGTDLATMGFPSVPDARGRFLRMKDHGAGTNLDGDVAIGTLQTDDFSSHTHTEPRLRAGGSMIDGNIGPYTWSVSQASGTAGAQQTSPVGGSETRPKNVTVNVFVKLNHG